LINGFVTFEELKFITGLAPLTLRKLIKDGMEVKAIESSGKVIHKDQLFDLKQTLDWISLHIY